VVHSFLADVVVLLHLAFIAFAAFGGLLVLRWRRAPWLHLPAVAWGVVIELSGGVCPLTPLENWLRRSAGSSGYEGGFVEHYVLPIVYPPALTRRTQLLLAGLLVLVNIALYAFAWWRARGARGPRIET
jgi:hypothetical protein